MQHLDRLIREHPHLRKVDYQRLVQKAQAAPAEHWAELVEASAPVAYTLALRLAANHPHAASLAEYATFELFQSLRQDDFARLRAVVGYGRWPSLLLRWLGETPSLRELDSLRQGDPDQPLPEIDAQVRRHADEEGDRLVRHMERVLRALHRHDRLLLAMRYEQGLSLRELDRIFRLGSPQRVASLLARLEASLQPIQAVGDQAGLSQTQRSALLAELVRRIFTHDMQSDEHRASAAALQHR